MMKLTRESKQEPPPDPSHTPWVITLICVSLLYVTAGIATVVALDQWDHVPDMVIYYFGGLLAFFGLLAARQRSEAMQRQASSVERKSTESMAQMELERKLEREAKRRHILEDSYCDLFAQASSFIRYFKSLKAEGKHPTLDDAFQKFGTLYYQVVAIRIRESEAEMVKQVGSLAGKMGNLGVESVSEKSSELYADLNSIIDNRARLWRELDGHGISSKFTDIAKSGEYRVGEFNLPTGEFDLLASESDLSASRETVITILRKAQNTEDLSPEANKIMNTLWKFNRKSLLSESTATWGFSGPAGSSEHTMFTQGSAELVRMGLVAFTHDGLLGLTSLGREFVSRCEPEGLHYDGFEPLH